MQVPSLPPIEIDFSGIGQSVVNALTGWAQDVLEPIPQQMMDWLNAGIAEVWNGIWDSGANLLATPFALTIDFGPAKQLGIELSTLIYGITSLSIVLLGLRMAWRTFSGRGGALSDAVDGVLQGIFLAGASTFIIAQAFYLCGLASDAIGRIDYRPSMEPQNMLSIGPSLILGLFTIFVMMLYGWRLMVRAAYRIVLLMFLAPFAPVAGILWAIPQTRWVSILYWVTIGGWLAGGFLAIGAISLGVQLALNNTNGILSLIFGVALVQVAYDLMSMLVRGASGGIQVGSPFNALVSAGTGLFGGAVAGGAASAAAVNGASYTASAVAGALPSGEQPGYGY